MGMLTGLGTRLRRRAEPTRPVRRAVEPARRATEAVFSSAPAPIAATPEQVAARARRVRLVAEDVETGERTVLGDALPWRAVEVLGSAGLFYGSCYENRDRPFNQVVLRRSWATYLGRIFWDMAEERVGIQTPVVDDLPRLTA